MSRIENNVNQSVFDSALHKTSQLMSNFMSPTKNQLLGLNLQQNKLSYIQEQETPTLSIS